MKEDNINHLEDVKMIKIRFFENEDFTQIQCLYEKEGWNTIIKRPQDGLKAWQNSNIALVATLDDAIIGVIRGFSDTQITTYIAELLIDKNHRGIGIGRRLIDECHGLYPNARIEVIATEFSKSFYSEYGFREIYGFRKSFSR